MKLTFLGAAGTVTGSKYLLEHRGHKLLIDCGLFQGWKALREMNWEPLPFEARDIDAVLLTHAHLDHSGALPLLVRQGFKGMVLATPPTIDLCKLLLPDSGRIQEEDAAFANRHHTSRHEPAQPLYTEDDALLALRRLAHLPFDTPAHVVPGVKATFHRAGHILGAASVALDIEGRTLLFSGDVGRPDDLLMREPAPSRRRTGSSWSPPTATGCMPPRMPRLRWERWSRARPRAAARWSCPPSRWAAPRPCCSCSTGSSSAVRSPTCRYSWTARWPST